MDYQIPFKLTGKLTTLTRSGDRPKLTPEPKAPAGPEKNWMQTVPGHG